MPLTVLPAPRASTRSSADGTADEAVGWRARMALELAPQRGRTRIVRRSHHGPLTVQRALYPEGEHCHVLLLHPPGGLVGLDELTVSVRLAPDAGTLVTTPGATKIYRNEARHARVEQSLQVARGARLEWLPQETIVFDGAHAALATRIELEAGAAVAAWEVICLGRPASGERFTRGALSQDIDIRVAGAPRYAESWRLDGGAPALQAAWGLGGDAVFGTFFALPVDAAARDAVRACDWPNGVRAGVTALDDLLIVRVIGDDTERTRLALERAWSAVRAAVIGRAPSRPRIWNT